MTDTVRYPPFFLLVLLSVSFFSVVSLFVFFHVYENKERQYAIGMLPYNAERLENLKVIFSFPKKIVLEGLLCCMVVNDKPVSFLFHHLQFKFHTPSMPNDQVSLKHVLRPFVLHVNFWIATTKTVNNYDVKFQFVNFCHVLLKHLLDGYRAL